MRPFKELLNFTPVLKTETRPLTQALDYQLAQEIVATLDHPPLPQSAMDGFAIGVPCELNRLSYDIVSESFAGGVIALRPDGGPSHQGCNRSTCTTQ